MKNVEHLVRDSDPIWVLIRRRHLGVPTVWGDIFVMLSCESMMRTCEDVPRKDGILLWATWPSRVALTSRSPHYHLFTFTLWDWPCVFSKSKLRSNQKNKPTIQVPSGETSWNVYLNSVFVVHDSSDVAHCGVCISNFFFSLSFRFFSDSAVGRG